LERSGIQATPLAPTLTTPDVDYYLLDTYPNIYGKFAIVLIVPYTLYQIAGYTIGSSEKYKSYGFSSKAPG